MPESRPAERQNEEAKDGESISQPVYLGEQVSDIQQRGDPELIQTTETKTHLQVE